MSFAANTDLIEALFEEAIAEQERAHPNLSIREIESRAESIAKSRFWDMAQ
tara:strand:- start:31101 stop:31253 length:153 start_codon:yes stop_codon:yes gene_type:complete